MWGYYDASGMAWWMILSSLFWLGLAAVAVWALVRWLSGVPRATSPRSAEEPPGPAPRSPTPAAPLSAVEILKARYARGEIDTATFQMMRAELEGTTTPSAQPPHAAVPSGR